MFKHRFKTAAALAGLAVLAANIPAAAAPVLVEEFEKNGAYVSVWVDSSCEIPEIPEINIPGTPETPDNGLPEIPEQPEAPDNGLPEIPEQPETPDNSLPEIPEQPETPDNNQPENPEVPELPDTESQSYAMQVIRLVNEERAKEGLPALVYDAGIEAAALIRAKETEKSFSHTRPDGRSFSTALTEEGVTFRGSGENIAYGQRTPEQVMEGWMNSPGHRANIMNKNFTKIGVGYYRNSSGVNYWTQLFTS